MKKWLTAFLMFTLCILLCGCKSDEVQQVELLIDSIGVVEVGSKADINTALTAYDALPEEEKKNVGNYAVLTEAVETYNSFYETVQITNDNWEDYFEEADPLFWGVDVFGEVNSVSRALVLRVNKDYTNRVDMDASELTVKYREIGYEWNCTLDWDAQELDLLYPMDTFPGRENVSWSSATGLKPETSLEKRFLEENDDENLLFFTFGELLENQRYYTSTEKQDSVELLTYDVINVVGTISVLKPEYEPYIPPKTEIIEEPLVIEGYTPVALTLENWQTYLEMSCVETWEDDESGNLCGYSQSYQIDVKKEWRDRLNFNEGTNIFIGMHMDETNRYYEMDWESGAFTLGDRMDDYTETDYRILEAEFHPVDMGDGTGVHPQMFMSRPTRLSVSREPWGIQSGIEEKTGKTYLLFSEGTVSRVGGTLYLKNE